MEGFWLVALLCWNHWFWTVPICAVVAGFLTWILEGLMNKDEDTSLIPRELGSAWLIITVFLCLAAMLWVLIVLWMIAARALPLEFESERRAAR